MPKNGNEYSLDIVDADPTRSQVQGAAFRELIDGRLGHTISPHVGELKTGIETVEERFFHRDYP